MNEYKEVDQAIKIIELIKQNNQYMKNDMKKALNQQFPSRCFGAVMFLQSIGLLLSRLSIKYVCPSLDFMFTHLCPLRSPYATLIWSILQLEKMSLLGDMLLRVDIT